MEHSRLVYLLEQYDRGDTTEQELDELENWYDQLGASDHSFREWLRKAGSEAALASELYDDLMSRKVPSGKIVQLRPLRNWWRLVATLAGVVFLLGIGYRVLQHNKTDINTISFVTPQSASDSRHFMLPDSSRILLQAGSEVQYEDHENERTVALEGEAYFDVQHKPEKPFVIRAGDITVRVVGTAFNVKAYRDQNKVTVAVTRGKVKVEKGDELLGILIQDQKIVYDAKSRNAETHTNEEEQDPVKRRMEFESVSFKTIARQLEQRYGITIRFGNKELEGCPVTASFQGTETIQEILDVLTATRGATYKIENKGKLIVVEGKGCGL
ncbi:hypothetical protein DSL64_17795 [Dyadobacter luteus]|uniref:Iron dicitrate transport regulator FecR n=1 Tax=Dyadobacter luteus TaxID=2259619 RepID=A0A3D8Y9K5_9BACT|nr:FecR domain-containing protein [Dyadobacter luteus]REA59503.1 hypothetical protein DSL64_17795 [Dyadobacter luteus]